MKPEAVDVDLTEIVVWVTVCISLSEPAIAAFFPTSLSASSKNGPVEENRLVGDSDLSHSQLQIIGQIVHLDLDHLAKNARPAPDETFAVHPTSLWREARLVDCRMGCSESKDEIHLQDLYRKQLKNASVVAAMELLEINFRDAGVCFYRVFAKMDTELVTMLAGLSATILFLTNPRVVLLASAQAIRSTSTSFMFSSSCPAHGFPTKSSVHLVRRLLPPVGQQNLTRKMHMMTGHQSFDRAVTFDDFVLNMWNFCTMSVDDITNHVFCLYDDDHSGTLDTAECDSLFRLLYNTSELPAEIKKLIAEVDANEDGLLDKDEFAMICKKNRNLLKPIFQLQASAQEKCLGKAYWKREQKKRPRILADQKNVFQLATQRIEREHEPQHKSEEKIQPSSNAPSVADSGPPQRRASERMAARQIQQELEELESWIAQQEAEQPVVDRYLKAHCERHITTTHLSMVQRGDSAASQRSADEIQLLTDLRHYSAICEKRFDEAKYKLQAAWGEEEAAARSVHLQAVRATVGAVSAQTFKKHSGKENAASAMGSYLQKKLDAATEEVHAQFQERWETLEKAAALLGDRALATAPPPEQRMKEKKPTDKRPVVQRVKSSTRVLPVAPEAETWTEFFDATQNMPYYVSSLGHSTWDRPATFKSG